MSKNIEKQHTPAGGASPGEHPREEAALAAWDRKRLLSRLGGDEALLKVLVQTFRSEWPRLLANMRKYLEAEDLERLGRTAHTLKGAAANLEAIAVRELALLVERSARENNLCQTAAGLEELDRAGQNFLEAVREFPED